MTPNRWQQLVGNIKDNFEVVDEGKQDLPEDRGPGALEFIIFQGPMGKTKLEFTTRPLVTGKKTLYSRRMGTSATVEYVYSDTEKTHSFKAYKDVNGEWEEIAYPTG